MTIDYFHKGYLPLAVLNLFVSIDLHFPYFHTGKTIFSCDQADLRTLLSIRPSVRLSHLFYYVPIIVSLWNFQEWLPMTEVISMQKVKVRGQRSRSQRSKPTLVVSVLWLQFEFTGGYEMMHKAWSCIEEVSHCFSSHPSNLKVTRDKKIADFDPNLAFLDCNLSW